jgi:very-short-patch-repair endonuclease
MLKELVALARRQSGVLSRAQARRFLTQDAIDRRVRSGQLVRLHAGVYALAGAPDTFERRITAAVLAAGGDAAASHHAAAALHGLGGTEIEKVVEISVPRAQNPRLDETVVVHRVTHLPPEHTFERDGIRITTRPRTICDLAGVLSADDLELVLDHALVRELVRLASVARTLQSLPENTKGAAALRALIAARPDGRARVESPLEQKVQKLLTKRGLAFEPQHLGEGFRIDIAFPRERLAVEPMGFRWHASRKDWTRDRRREALLIERGWRVLPVTWEDLERPEELVERIRAALAAARVGVGSAR